MDLYKRPDDEFAELVWEDGQLVMQNQSGRARKNSFPTSASSFQYPGVQEKDSRRSVDHKFNQYSALDGFPNSTQPVHDGDNAHDEDVVPWINYPIDEVLASETLHNDYSAEFLNEFPAFNENLIPAHKNTIATGRHEHVSRGLSENPEPGKTGSNQLFQLPLQCQAPNSKSTVVDVGAGSHNAAQEVRCGEGMISSKQLQQQCGVATLMNFSHFARPAALAKINGHLNAAGLRSLEKVTGVSSSNPVSLENVHGSKNVNNLELGSAMKASHGVGSVAQSNTICIEDVSQKNRKAENCSKFPQNLPSSSFAASVALCRHDTKKDPETIMTSSSMCSGSITGTASNEPVHSEKRKEYDGDDSDYHSEDIQDESVELRKPPSGRGSRIKRSRAAEVHNLSERRRRNRINEKMRALQDLIPNCNKVDKASMLEEAIEYLKTLQLQVQIMSMGSRLYMPPMMLPVAMQHMRAPTMAHFSPLGVGMSTGIGLAPGCPMMPIPPMHAPLFPSTSTSGQSVLNTIAGPLSSPMYGVQGQGITVLMPRPTQFSTFPGFSMNTSTVPDVHADSANAVAEDQQQQQNLNAEPKTSTNDTQIPRNGQTQHAGGSAYLDRRTMAPSIGLLQLALLVHIHISHP